MTLDPPVLTDTVTINYSIDLRLVSDLVGAPVDEIEALNPSLLRMEYPARRRPSICTFRPVRRHF